MQALLRKIRQILKDRRTRKVFTRIVSSVAAIVVFVTTYALILPAITLEKTAICGIEAHQHDGSCYEERLVCGQEESDGHHHDDSCYTTTAKLNCGIQEHLHSDEEGCYDADGNLVCQLQEHAHADSCYGEVRTLACGLEESEGHHHTDSCYEKVLICGKEVHIHSDKCYEEDGSKEASADRNSDGTTSNPSGAGNTDNTKKAVPRVSDSDEAAEEKQSDSYVPELEPVDMDAMLNSHTDFYFYHAEEGEEVPADSAEIADWRKAADDAILTSTDLVKMHLAYTIPAGSLNETNPSARYRLPSNLHLSDRQIKAMNSYENGIAAGYRDSGSVSDTSDASDMGKENKENEYYQKYLGAEAVEGDRRPDEQLKEGAQEYISAVVRAENVYDDNGEFLGQDLIFTFVPYSIEKNRNTYDADKTLVSAGEKITGWFACDFKLNQIDWEEEKTARITFVQEDQDKKIEEISRVLKMDGEIGDGTSSETMTDVPEETGEDQDDQVFKAGTLTFEGDDYSITLDYGEDAKIPENASLSVREITAETDKEAYEACLEQAGQQVAADDNTSVDQKASRFFDIEIVVTETDSDGTEKTVKIEPSAPVSVNIQINEKPASQESESDQSEPTVLHFAEKGVEQIDSTVTNSQNNDVEEQKTEIQFEAESFSVYGVVYTVDFHYEINGKMYDFSIPGGGFVSLEHVVEVLGIASADENTEKGTENAENDAENGNDFAGEVPGVDENGENGTVYEEAIKLNEVEVSESTKKFVMDVESVEFSSPELVWVGKVDEATTVGGLKEVKGLEVEYSTELTEEQIAEINAQTVEAGDWALISMLPFDSEETLTVTMKNGDQFTVKVTDAQPANTNTNWNGHYNDFERGNTNRFVIWGVGSDGKNYVLKTDGTTEEFDPNTIDTLGAEYLWTIEYGWRQGWDYDLNDWDYRYYIRPVNDPTKCLALNNGYISSENLVSSESSGTHLYSPYSRHKNQWDNNYTNNNAGWILEGWGWTRLNLGNSSHQFEGHQQYCSNINISRVQPPYTYNFIVRTDDYERGGVSGIDKGGINRQVEESFTATTYSTSGFNKTNLREIKAVPKTQKWAFDHWELDGKTLYWDTSQRKIVFEQNRFTEVYSNLNADRASVINAGSLPITFNGSTLTAYFKRNPNYEAPDDDKDGRPIDATVAEWLEQLLDADFPLNKDATQKTAEVYDYENRIYRVDITAASNLYALDKNVKLGFILDVSASMKFPSQLNMVLNSNNTQTTTDPTKQLALQLNNINDNYQNKRWLDQSKTYYIIADKTGTATVDKIFYKNGSWRWTDASKNNDTEINQNTKFHNSDDAGLTYPIYLAGDPVTAADLTSQEGNLLRSLGLGVGDPRPRAYYLQRSMRETTAELQQIMNKISVAANPNQASEVLIAWNTFCGNVNDSDHTFKSPANVSFRYSYDGGTSTQLALEDARSFGWGSDGNTSRFAILITDGAPQKSSVAIGNDVVAAQATALKNRGTATTADDITLITLGLSMGDVRRGEILLYDIASRDQENVPYYYEAESGNELGLALAEVIRIAMANAIVEGNVTDTVNEAFYPVDKLTGLPLENGYVINLNGELIAYSESSLTSEQRNAGYGVISETNGTYSVTWTGQEFTWEGWHGTIYEKAKEDFLGGNAVRTNDPDHAAVVTSTGYKLHTGDTAIPFKDSIKTAGTKEMETPRVNVNELQIEGNNTEWTVYLGESVDPLEQIKALYNSIRVNQVITNGIDTDGDGFKDKGKWDWITFEEDYPLYYDLVESASDDRENETYGEQEFFYLSNLIKKLNGGNDIDWDRLIELSNETGDGNTGITFPYNLYNQDNPGWITIKLEKNHSVDPHATDQVGSQVETYTLTAFFSPLYDHTPVGLGGDGLYPYHTGNYGLGNYGNAPGTEEVTNEHKINVFAKKLEIKKADQSGNTITGDTATFVLYRKATQAELDDDAVTKTTLSELDGKFVAVQTLTTDGGVVTTESLPLLADNEPYYMVETKAPAGYIMLTQPLKVTIDMAGHNTWTKLSDNSTSQTKPDPYVLSNWLQEATIKIWNPDGTAYDPSLTHVYDHTNDTTEASVVYKILNNAGYELPSTGGPGTTTLYLLGSILILGAGVLLWRRRRTI